MPHAGLSCPGCGSSNIVDDDLYCQAQLVCADCGSVVSEGALANDPVNVGGSDVSYSRTTAQAKKPCVNLIKGQQRLKAMCRILRVNGEIEDLSQTYYNQAYQHESFIKVSLQKKEILAGCCLLLSCRLLNWPITMGTISCLLDADPMVVGVTYQETVKILNIEAPIVGITDVIETHCQEYKITSRDVPEELAVNTQDLTKRAVELVELAADSWIVTGRRPVPIMMAAIYLSWQSLKPDKHRRKFSLDKFCQLAKVTKHKPAVTRLTEMKEVLCKLGKEIPWVREVVTPDNVVRLVEDILKHRHALMRRALRTHEASQAEQTPPACELNEETAQRPGDGDERPNSDPEANWGKRALFAPPCVIHSKRRILEQPELKDVTGDEEISDSEIDSYIRTPQEVREFALTQKMLS